MKKAYSLLTSIFCVCLPASLQGQVATTVFRPGEIWPVNMNEAPALFKKDGRYLWLPVLFER